jgi:1A family penicillin-binding protein
MKAKKLKRYSKNVSKVFLRLVLMIVVGFLSVFAFLGAAGLSYAVYINSTLPSYDEMIQRDIPESSKVYSRDGTLLYEFHGEYKRTSVGLDHISPHLKNATIAVEDKDFYNHGAISITSIGRALLANYRNKGVVQGGSTITQQFVKNALLDRGKTYRRKVSEVLLSYKIESHFNKDEILSLYLNEIPYGRNAYGVEAAAQTYFGKSSGELNITESAYLAALPQAPSYYSPTGSNTEALDERKDFILDQMYKQGYITELELHQAQNTPVAFKEARTDILAPYFVSWIQNYLTEKYGKEFLREGGLKVYTTLDLKLQGLAEQVVREGADSNKTKYGAYNAALVAVEPSSGKILAMAGGKDYFGKAEPAGCRAGVNCKFEPNVNVSTSMRQPGSSFKPYAYLTAFKPEHGFTPLSKVLDVPTMFGYSGGRPYIPRNYDGSSHGLITMRKALAGSLNVPAVRTLQTVGVDNVVKTAHDLGISSALQNCGLSLVLGGCEVELVDHVGAFAVIANGGKGKGATPFIRIQDKNGQILEQYQERTEQAVNPEAVYELISIMTDDASRQFVFGRNNPLTLPGRTVAAKTGTTQNWKDGWTLGFTPQLAAGVWAGNNDSSLMRSGADGVFVAAPIWHRFMEEALKDQVAMDFPVPSGIVQIAFDANTNRPATQFSRNTRMEPFPYYAVPKDMQVSAAPKGQNNFLTPLDTPPQVPVPQPETPLTTPPPPLPSNPQTNTSIDPLPTSVDYGGVPQEEVIPVQVEYETSPNIEPTSYGPTWPVLYTSEN